MMGCSATLVGALLLLTPVLVLGKPPNVILFVTDDQDVEMQSLAYMPVVKKLLIDEGATFTRMYAHVPVCCPSRSSLYSGRYMHNTGCRGNAIETNCSSPAWQNGPEKRAFATHFASAGYKTSFAGKYLNDYGSPSVGGVAHIPPGWSNWHGLVGNSVYYDYTLSNNGVAERHGNDYETDYLPNLILNRTLTFLDANLGTSPVLAVLSTPSCHGPQEAAPQYQSRFPGITAPRSPTFNATVTGTHWIQSVKAVYPFDDNAAAYSDLVFRRRLQTLLTVDDILATIVAKLDAAGELDNTFIAYTADNGYHTGAFGFVYDKRQPWETDTHLPLLIRGPGIKAGISTAAPVSMPDLSATLLDMAGITPPPIFDGASVLPYISATPPPPRIATLVEYVGEGGGGGGPKVCPLTAGDNSLMCNSASNYSLPPFFYGNTDFCLCQDSLNTTYSCLRVVSGVNAEAEKARMVSTDSVITAPAVPAGAVNYRFCVFPDVVEFFDYTLDPFELVNRAEAMDSALKAALHARLTALHACHGSAECLPLLTTPIA